MKKKWLSILLSAAVIGSSGGQVYAAEFLDGLEINREEAFDVSGEDIFSEENSQADEGTFSISDGFAEEEGGFSETEIADIPAEETETLWEGEGIPGSSQENPIEISAGESVDLPADLNCTYVTLLEGPGIYELHYDGGEDLWVDLSDETGTWTESCDYWDNDMMFFAPQGIQAIYMCLYEDVSGGTFSVTKINTEEVTLGREYSLPESSVCWFAFRPEKAGEYVVESTAYYETAELYDEKGSYLLSLTLGGIDGLHFDEEEFSQTFYLKCENTSAEPYTISIKKSIQDIFADMEDIPVLLEKETGVAETALTPDENGTGYAKFLPQRTGKYVFSCREPKDTAALPPAITIYDSDFDKVYLDENFARSFDKGKTYYIVFSDMVNEAGQNRLLCLEYTGPVSITVEKGLSRHTFYWKIDLGFPGVVVKVAYGDGKEELISHSIRYGTGNITSRGDFVQFMLRDSEGLGDYYLPGTYTAEAYINDDLRVELGTVEVKNTESMPTIDVRGLEEAVITAEGTGWIQLKTGDVSEYVLDCPYENGYMTVERMDKYGSLRDVKRWIVPGSTVTLEPNSVYYINAYTGFNVGPDEMWISVKALGSVQLSDCAVTLPASVVYTGKALKPSVKIKEGEYTLKKGEDYTLTYADNKETGTASVTITGQGTYTGTVEKTFKIVPAAPKLVSAKSTGYHSVKVTWRKAAGAKTYRLYYKGGDVKNWTLVKSGIKNTAYTHTSEKLISGTKYTYMVKAVNKKSISSYNKNGVSAVPVPAQVKISKAASVSTGLNLTWSKVDGASGYEIQRKDNGKWVTKKTIAKGTTLKFVDKTAKKGKSYSYRIRAYRTVNKKKVYGSYSAVKKAKR